MSKSTAGKQKLSHTLSIISRRLYREKIIAKGESRPKPGRARILLFMCSSRFCLPYLSSRQQVKSEGGIAVATRGVVAVKRGVDSARPYKWFGPCDQVRAYAKNADWGKL